MQDFGGQIDRIEKIEIADIRAPDFMKHRNVGSDDRNAATARFDERQAESFDHGWKDQRAGALVAMSEIGVARIVQPEETASIFRMTFEVALQSFALPARPTDDDIARIEDVRAP